MSDFTKSKQNMNAFLAILSNLTISQSQRQGKFLVACISDWSFFI